MTSQLPRPDDYNSAVQNPRSAFKDPILQNTRVKTNPLGLPIVASGGFTVVYPMEGNGQRWAVRCIHRPMPDLQQRYQAISAFLQQYSRPYFVEAQYQHEGIRVNGTYYPIIRMPWIDGHTLSSHIERTIQQPAQFALLADVFAQLIADLEQIGAAHGDLQHGNILVAHGTLQLIDYDSMFVPALAGQQSPAFGHVNFQHPGRSNNDFHPRIDRFSSMVIYLALRALAIDPTLWNFYGAGGENLLFQQSDFVKPHQSKLLAALKRIPTLRRMVGQFQTFLSADPNTLPSLAALIAGTQSQVTQRAHQTSTLRRQFEVVRADDLKVLRDRVNQRVEVVGQITGVDFRKTKTGSDMVFIDFGDWRQGAFRLVLWSSAIDIFQLRNINLESYHGKWVSMTGVITRYIDQQRGQDRVQIIIELPSEIEAIGGPAEVKRRIAANAHLRTASVATSIPVTPTPAIPTPSKSVPLPIQPPPVVVTPSIAAKPPRAGSAPAKKIPFDVLPRPHAPVALPAVPAVAPVVTRPPVQTVAPPVLVVPAPVQAVAPPAQVATRGTRAAATPTAVPVSPSCPSCAQINRPGARSCGYCGKPLPVAPRFAPEQSLQKGKYTIKRLLSRGGMGEIYYAIEHHPTLPDIGYVIKVMLDYYDVANPQAVRAARARFKQEAATLRTLSHKTIPKILNYFDEDQSACIVMEYIEGRSLEQELTHVTQQGTSVAGHAYPIDRVVQWGIAICHALEYLEGTQPPVIHQDIKPANLLLDRHGDIRLVDFGTARVEVVQPTHAAIQQKSIYGTPGYAPPEQYSGQVEPRSDVYALAATLYHLMTDDEPIPSAGFPRMQMVGDLEPILRRALAQNVTARPHAMVFRQQLEDYLRQQQIVAAAPVPAPAPPVTTLAAPNGQILATPQMLGIWLEQHWEQGRNWLFSSQAIIDHLRHVWRSPDLAMAIKQLCVTHALAPDVALDQVIALLDANGFGLEKPHIGIDKRSQVMAFPHLSARQPSSQELKLKNIGRRYVQLRIETPNWLRFAHGCLSYIPGQEAAVTFETDFAQIAPAWKLQRYIQFYHQNLLLEPRILIRASLSLAEQLRWRFGKKTP